MREYTKETPVKPRTPAQLFRHAAFVKAINDIRDAPLATAEICIAGRSNVGKSSLINALCAQKNLARHSKTPGRTQQLVYFQMADGVFLVDLPGYGYARVAKSTRAAWQQHIERYLNLREALQGMVVIADIRHVVRDTAQKDQQLLAYSAARGLPVLYVLNKADKLSRQKQIEAQRAVEAMTRAPAADIEICTVSATKKEGLAPIYAWAEAKLMPPTCLRVCLTQRPAPKNASRGSSVARRGSRP